jgi:hypothetical protein
LPFAGNDVIFLTHWIALPKLSVETEKMKHCPRCKTVFGNEDLFCYNDGVALVETVNPASDTPTQVIGTPPGITPPSYNPPPSAPGASKNYLKPLAVGLALGGLLVLVLYFMFNGFGGGRRDPAAAPENSHSKKYANMAREPDSRFNGRVIMANAYIRSQPDMTPDSEIEILPYEERINIVRRKSPNSPWYYITCEHGVSGWMHGDMIEFTSGGRF